MTEELDIRYITGDATCPVGTGNKIIAHVCNDIGAWGAGFVLAVSKRWSHTRQAYLAEKTAKGLTLGEIHLVKVEDAIWVANMIAQHGVGVRNGMPPIRYEALRKCLAALDACAHTLQGAVHMPRIGCGLAGGRWEVVEPLIREELRTAQ